MAVEIGLPSYSCLKLNYINENLYVYILVFRWIMYLQIRLEHSLKIAWNSLNAALMDTNIKAQLRKLMDYLKLMGPQPFLIKQIR